MLRQTMITAERANRISDESTSVPRSFEAKADYFAFGGEIFLAFKRHRYLGWLSLIVFLQAKLRIKNCYVCRLDLDQPRNGILTTLL